MVEEKKPIRGITSKKALLVPPIIMPEDPENKGLTKAEFIEKRKKVLDNMLKLKEFEAGLKQASVPSTKKPKKIE